MGCQVRVENYLWRLPRMLSSNQQITRYDDRHISSLDSNNERSNLYYRRTNLDGYGCQTAFDNDDKQ